MPDGAALAESSSCPICSVLKDREQAAQKYGWDEENTHLPAAAERLVIVRDFKPYGSRKSQLQQCPACGRYYLYETDYEYLVNGSEDEQSLTRLDSASASAYLEGEH